MHGLINRALQGFLVETYGRGMWDLIRRDAELPFEDFEAMLHYEADVSGRVIRAAAERLDKSQALLLEDVGTFLIAHPAQEPIRRLLRFGGADFREFLISLEDLPSRAQMALPDLEVPEFALQQESVATFTMTLRWGDDDMAPVVVGALRAMADDYGALVLLDILSSEDGEAQIGIELLDNEFAKGRAFKLGEAAI